MANNPYVNKVVYGNDTLLDLTGDTVTAGDMLSGVTAHDRSGAAITGTLEPVLGVEVNGTTISPDNNGIVDIGSVPSAPTALSLTAAAGSWSSATPPTQTITATGVTSNNNIIVGISGTATSTQLDEAAAAKLLCTAQGTDSITLTCYGTEPTGNIPISVLIVG